jgi:flagellar basal-body rod modification protein FlgD
MIDPTLAATAVTSALDLLQGTDPTPAPKANDAVDKSEFLQLLITQLQNQDPLNPLDSANFSAQLAQFSSLEQLTQINQHLADQTSTGAQPSRFEVLGLLGTEVRGVGSTVTLQAGGATPLYFDLPSAGTVQAQVFDASGRAVASIDLGTLAAGEHAFDLGASPDASTLGDGSYRVLLTAGDAPLETTVGGRVTGVDLAGDSPVLLIGDTRLTLDDLREVRAGSATQS